MFNDKSTKEISEKLMKEFENIKDQYGLTYEKDYKGFTLGYVLGTFNCYDKMKKREKEENENNELDNTQRKR